MKIERITLRQIRMSLVLKSLTFVNWGTCPLAINSPILSRLRVFHFQPLSEEEVVQVLERGIATIADPGAATRAIRRTPKTTPSTFAATARRYASSVSAPTSPSPVATPAFKEDSVAAVTLASARARPSGSRVNNAASASARNSRSCEMI